MINTLRQIIFLLTSSERRQACWCFLAMLVMALMEVLGVASIMPFMAVIADPEAIQHHAKLAWLYHKLHFSSTHSFLIFLGLAVLVAILLSSSLTILTMWFVLKFTYAREYSLSKRLLLHYLSQPYVFFLNRNSAELSKNILSGVSRVVNQAFIPLMQMIAKLIVTLFILALLLMVDPVLALTITVVLGGLYACIYLAVRRKLAAISKICVEYNHQKYKIVGEALGGIKDIKLLGKEENFVGSFSFYAKKCAEDEAAALCIYMLPRYMLEAIAFGGVLLIILYLLMMQRNITDVMPLLALYAFASFRLMPAVQQIFASITYMRISKDALDVVFQDLNQRSQLSFNKQNQSTESTLSFKHAIELRDVTFAYPESTRIVTQNLNLTIPVKLTVGFVGMTGAGKTTIVDLILGLLFPDQGKIFVDDVCIDKTNVMAWQKKIGYVSQTIFLADDTIAQNIAFGIPNQHINLHAVEEAAKAANIHQFILEELKDGYQTLVGDRGIRLSGGQRQRIGIARALYHNPEVLVFDEATSSLDNMTENVILEAINHLARKKTIIMIAHRLTTLVECDMIHVLENGKIISSGTYHELIQSCAQFKNMARVNT